jgi:hypothetical protein
MTAFILPKWVDVFADFIETGEAPDEFLHYLAMDRRAQQAADLAIEEFTIELINVAKQSVQRRDTARRTLQRGRTNLSISD